MSFYNQQAEQVATLQQQLQQLMDERDAAVEIMQLFINASDIDEGEYALAEAKQFINNLNKRS